MPALSETERPKPPFPNVLHAIIVGARKIATPKHNCIDAEDVLLATVEAFPSVFKEGLGLEPETVKQQILIITGEGEEKGKIVGNANYLTPPASTAVLRAIEEAEESGATKVNVFHILAGLVRTRYGFAAQVLAECGIDEGKLGKIRDLAKNLKETGLKSNINMAQDDFADFFGNLKRSLIKRFSSDPKIATQEPEDRKKTIEKRIALIEA